MFFDKIDNEKYFYIPVSGSTIRLFELLVGQDHNDGIHGRLRHTTLDNAPPFLALSYHWGTKKERFPIDCDGSKLYVTESLDGALQQLRCFCLQEADNFSTFPSKYIWADQICINQDDLVERSAQVKLMGLIYSGAIGTVAWLGHSQEWSSKAWALVDDIYIVFDKENPGAANLGDIKPQLYSETQHIARGLPNLSDPIWKQLRALVDTPWFSRTWIIQEVALSQQDPILIHGKHVYSFHRLGWVASWLRRKGYLRRPEISQGFQNIDTISNIRRSREKWTLDTLLMTTSWKFNATNPRDKIYGLLGLARETQDHQLCPEALRPNYELSIVQVYQNVALYLFHRYQSLAPLTRCLSQKPCRKRFRQLGIFSSPPPSWVPNWSDVLIPGDYARSFVWIGYSHTGNSPSLGFPRHFRAAKGLPPAILPSVRGDILRMRALCVDKIVCAVPFIVPLKIANVSPSFIGSSPEIIHKSIQDSFFRHIWALTTKFGKFDSYQDLIQSFIRATTANQSHMLQIEPEELGRDGAAYLIKILKEPAKDIERNSSWLSILLLLHCCIPAYTDAYYERLASRTHEEVISELTRTAAGGSPETFSTLARNFCLRRCFFVTAQGRLGLGPEETSPGNLIYVIPGGDVPYVVSTGQFHTKYIGSSSYLIGECYVDRLMDGQAIDACNRGEIEYQTLQLS